MHLQPRDLDLSRDAQRFVEALHGLIKPAWPARCKAENIKRAWHAVLTADLSGVGDALLCHPQSLCIALSPFTTLGPTGRNRWTKRTFRLGQYHTRQLGERPPDNPPKVGRSRKRETKLSLGVSLLELAQVYVRQAEEPMVVCRPGDISQIIPLRQSVFQQRLCSVELPGQVESRRKIAEPVRGQGPAPDPLADRDALSKQSLGIPRVPEPQGSGGTVIGGSRGPVLIPQCPPQTQGFLQEST